MNLYLYSFYVPVNSVGEKPECPSEVRWIMMMMRSTRGRLKLASDHDKLPMYP